MRAKLLVLSCLLLVCGCDTTSQERIAWLESTIKTLDTQITDANSTLNQYKAEWVNLRTALDDPNMGGTLQEIAQKMGELEEKIAGIVPRKELLQRQKDVYLAELNAILARGDINVGDEIAAYGKGGSAVAPMLPPPIGAWVSLASAIATVVGALIGNYIRGRKAQEEAAQQKNQSERAIGGIVDSVSVLLSALPTEPTNGVLDQESAKSILARAQVKVPESAEAVRAALKSK